MIDIMIKWQTETQTRNNLKKLTTQQQKMIFQVFVNYRIIYQMFDKHLVTYLQHLQSIFLQHPQRDTNSNYRNTNQQTITVNS